MFKLRHNQSGFSVVEVLLIVLAIGVIGGAGYYVYQRSLRKPAATPTAANKPAEVNRVAETPPPDPTASWTAYSDTEGKFSLKYPATWVRATHPERCSPGILLLGPDTKSVGVCASEGFGQVFFVSVDGDQRSNFAMSTGYGTVTKEPVTVAGVVGEKSSATVTGDRDELGSGPPIGTKSVRYVFFTGGKTYQAGYDQAPTYSDVLSDFNLLVTTTLKFAP